MRQAWARLTTAHAVSWTVFWLSFAGNLFVYFSGNPQDATAPTLARLGVVVCSQIAMWTVILLAHGTALRDPASPRWRIAAVFVAAGAARGAAIGLANEAFGVTSSAELAFRMANGAVVMTFVLIVSAVVADAVAEHRVRLAEAMAEQARLDAIRRDFADDIARHWEDVANRVAQDLYATAIGVTFDAPDDSVERLRSAAQEIVRPLSHRLAASPEPVEMPTIAVRNVIDWRHLLRDATAPGCVAPMQWAWLFALFGSVYAIHTFGLIRGIAGLAAAVVAVMAAGAVVGRVYDLLARGVPGVWRVPLLFIALGLTASVGVLAARTAVGDHRYQNVLWIIVPYIVAFGWVWALARAALLERQRAVLQLEEINQQLSWEIARANDVQWQRQRALARALHGPVQAALNAGVLRLDAAIRGGLLSDNLVAKVRASIDESLLALVDAAPESVDLQREFAGIARTWEGVCTIETEASPVVLASLELDPFCAGTVLDVVVEACSNAVRHGSATWIRVCLSALNERTVEVRVDDNGHGTERTSSGLGTLMLNDLAVSWSRSRTAEGTALVAALPRRAVASST